MDANKARPFGGSASMPMLPTFLEDSIDQDPFGKVLEQIRRSPGYQFLWGNGGSTESQGQRAVEIVSPSPSPADASELMGSPQSDGTVRAGDTLVSGSVAETPTRAGLRGGGQWLSAQGKDHIDYESVVQESALEMRPQAPVFQPKGSLGNPHSTDQKASAEEYKYTSNSTTPSTTSKIDGLDTKLQIKKISSMDRIGAIGSERSAAKVASTPKSTHHNRQAFSRLSFAPVEPSPLGPSHITRKSSPEGSGLLIPVPGSAPPTCPQFHPLSRTPGASTPAMGPATAGIPASWTQTTARSYQPFDMSPISDPFVESHPKAKVSNPVGGLPRRVFTTPTSTFTRPESQHQHSPLQPNFQTRQPEVYHPVTNLSIHAAPTIPAPALPFAAPLSPKSRAQRDVFKAIRKDWIRISARQIVDLALRLADLKAAYERSPTPATLSTYMTAQTAFDAATSFEKRLEERRNLTLPAGMFALRTDVSEDAVGGKAGGLLGSGMALRERVCAEAVGKEDKCRMEKGELSGEERRAVRGAVVRDASRGVERMGGWMGKTNWREREDGEGKGARGDGVQEKEVQGDGAQGKQVQANGLHRDVLQADGVQLNGVQTQGNRTRVGDEGHPQFNGDDDDDVDEE